MQGTAAGTCQHHALAMPHMPHIHHAFMPYTRATY
jgi:hypothetical protein